MFIEALHIQLLPLTLTVG